jgi:hypothetical protein
MLSANCGGGSFNNHQISTHALVQLSEGCKRTTFTRTSNDAKLEWLMKLSRLEKDSVVNNAADIVVVSSLRTLAWMEVVKGLGDGCCGVKSRSSCKAKRRSQ